MSGKRKQLVSFTYGPPAKRPRTTELSSRVVIEDLTKRNKRRKDPVGHRYTRGSTKRGPMLPVRKHVRPSEANPPSLPNVTFSPQSVAFVPDDFPNIAFEEILPPQRNRQVQKSDD